MANPGRRVDPNETIVPCHRSPGGRPRNDHGSLALAASIRGLTPFSCWLVLDPYLQSGASDAWLHRRAGFTHRREIDGGFRSARPTGLRRARSPSAGEVRCKKCRVARLFVSSARPRVHPCSFIRTARCSVIRTVRCAHSFVCTGFVHSYGTAVRSRTMVEKATASIGACPADRARPAAEPHANGPFGARFVAPQNGPGMAADGR